MSTKFSVLKLEKHDTRDVSDKHVNGSLTVVWRDWESMFKLEPKMVYVSSVNPGEIKGPHIHKQRTSYFSCLHGKVLFVVKIDGKYLEIESSQEAPNLICIPNNIPSAHINISDSVSRVLVLADVAWKPNDNEMENTTFENYDWSKWKF